LGCLPCIKKPLQVHPENNFAIKSFRAISILSGPTIEKRFGTIIILMINLSQNLSTLPI
jgi:hypothetical protein